MTKKLGDLCDIARGGSPRPIQQYLTNSPDGINWIKISDASASSKYIYETKEKIKPEGVTKSRLVQKDDFLLSNSMSFGRPYIMKISGCIHDGWLVLKDKSGLFDQDYLYYFLNSQAAYKQFDNLAAGSTVRNLNTQLVKNVIIPIPSIEEQKRIVEILDKAFEGIAQAEANTRQNLINIRNFFKRYLDKSIHKNNSNWDRVKFQDILSQQPRNGWSPPAENHSDIGVPVLTLSSVTGFHFNIQKIKFTNAPVKVGAHYWLNNGEFLMTRSNTSELVGHVAICENITEPTICCDLIMKMSINPQWAETKFIYWYFRTSKLRHLISNSAQGANPTMKKINKAIVQNFPVCIPPIVEQKKIVEQIEECYQKTQKLETIYQRKLEAIAELKQSILEKAFTGQLSQ
ncbi:MAG: restriction endonuclease subunit S [Microcystis viridis Mv_BB_P_19951000_S69]|uniref:Restriction endonuclease subunit S n=1 Tax=Microcystis viridis Mv_BB_P_19951000_S68D TaxID=2486270 RepID=A0A552HF77_MICVR|nr:MAG: restriction endonuclease subunit S [Microcystis viridis Mv_BB_P_19951000_S68D]TRU76873.1 MAG: restriction endonuclease subunit S [Microcystis viridis Mv_BB_P_19951000_S69]TRU78757.1 MAG: restriction endonuclease subunit S [Microcystis viridis Mv_BB_P_19951000_S68]TRU85060.1 MAG: restriction endonuclease subunit S [Microcystis viridis Mv_BB_P_19951000_S69D]